MTPAETAELLGFCAAFDRRTIGRADVAAWHTVLADIDHHAARQAVAEHYATETRWIMPADIRTAVKRHRANAAADYVGPGLPPAIPDADPDDVQGYLAALRQQRTRAADGEHLHPRPVAALLAGTGRRIPPPDGTARCPRCTGPMITRPGRPICGGCERAARTREAS